MAFAPTIYSIGDATFLAQVLNAVAMIMGTNDFVRLVSIGLLLGVLTVVLQGLFRGAKEIPWSQLLLGWMLYACMFVPTTTVIIEDSYTSRARPVDNVPIGVAFAGSMISNLGYGITVLFETAYSDVASATKRPFAEPLQIVNALREHSADEYVIQRLNAAIGPGTDMSKTLENYVKECSMPKLALRIVTPSDMNTQDALEVMEFNSNVYGTQIFINNSAGEQLTCKDAWAKIKPALDKVKDPAVITELSRAANLKGDNGPATIDDYSNAFDALNIDSNAVENFILVSLIKPIYEKGGASYLKSVGDRTAALMFNQAVMQRNSQWATEASMFMTVVRPFISFFEGFIFAVTPVLAFLLVLGGVGISLGMKYMLLILWIQLWMPVLSIINLYIIMSARGALANQSFTSFYSIDNCALALENWIATGGMLAAATPLISLFLITGSTFAFTSLTQRMAGADHINEKLHSPDAKSQGAFYAHDTAGNGNSALGAIRTGTEGAEGSISISSLKEQMVSSSKSKMESAMNSLNNLYGTTYSSSNEANAVANVQREIGKSIAASKDKSVTAANTAIDKSSFGKQVSFDERAQILDTLATGAQAGWSMPDWIKALSGIKINAQGGLRSDSSSATGQSRNMTEAEARELVTNFQSSDTSGLVEQRNAALAKTDAESVLKKAGVSSNSQYAKAFTNATTEAKNYQEVLAAKDSIGFNGSLGNRMLAGMIMSNPYAEQVFADTVNKYQGTAIEREAERISKTLPENFQKMNPKASRILGYQWALAKSGDGEASRALANILSAATGAHFQAPGDAKENQNIGGNIQNANDSGLRSREATEAKALEGENAVQPMLNANAAELGTSKGEIDTATETVMAQHAQNDASVRGNFEAEQKKVQMGRINAAAQGLSGPVSSGAGFSKPMTFMSQQEAIQRSVDFGLTDAQTMVMSRALMGAHGAMREKGHQALLEENQKLYGKEYGGFMDKEQVQTLTDNMVKHLENASWWGDKFENRLDKIRDFNMATTDFGQSFKEQPAQRIARINEMLGEESNIGPNAQERTQHNIRRGAERDSYRY